MELTWNGQDAVYQQRKYCCGNKEHGKWDDCQWYSDIGAIIVPVGTNVEGYCYTGCPSGQVRVALDQYGGGCEGDGGRSKCCKPNYTTLSKRSYTDPEQELADSVKTFMEDPMCEYRPFGKRSLDAGFEYGNASYDPGPLERRSSSKPQADVEQLLYSLVVTYSATAAGRDIWKNHVVSVYPNLTVESIRAFVESSTIAIMNGSADFVESIVCAMQYYNNFLADRKAVSCECERDDCCENDDIICILDGESDTSWRRDLLDKRSGPRQSKVELDNGQVTTFYSISVSVIY